MHAFTFFFKTHKWLGIALSLPLALVAVTGVLLLFKKDLDYLQPPTQRSAAAVSADKFLSIQEIFAKALAQEHPDFRSVDDIDRVDFRPGKGVHKLRSRHNYSEMQIDAVTGEVFPVATRRSDWIEQLHDGQWFGAWAHGVLMPVCALGLLYLVGSGVYMWLVPALRRRRQRRLRQRD